VCLAEQAVLAALERELVQEEIVQEEIVQEGFQIVQEDFGQFKKNSSRRK
jgi:hypothetical protein